MKATTLAQLGEDALVRRLTRGLSLAPDVIAGVGDDCAVVKPLAKGWLQLLKTDCVVEGIHFTRGTAPQQVGRKAMARAISDIGAAMGGEPQHCPDHVAVPAGSQGGGRGETLCGIAQGRG